MERFVYFGAGSDGARLLEKYAGVERVVGFVDNDPAKAGATFHGLPVAGPDSLALGDWERVRITSGATWEIYLQLLRMGIPRERIVADMLEPENLAWMESLINRHAGRRAFIIGNGPSLTMADLTAIAATGDLSFAFNKIWLAFDSTPFRPSYYLVDDLLVARNNGEAISALKGFPKLLPDVMLRWVERDEETHLFSLTFQEGSAPESLISEEPFRIYSGATVVYSALQFALLMGCDPIVLVGVDFSFSEPVGADGKVLTGAGEVNHFHPGYRAPGEKWFKPDQTFALKSFESAGKLAARKGIRIFNATRGGLLETFPRVGLDALLNSPTCRE